MISVSDYDALEIVFRVHSLGGDLSIQEAEDEFITQTGLWVCGRIQYTDLERNQAGERIPGKAARLRAFCGGDNWGRSQFGPGTRRLGVVRMEAGDGDRIDASADGQEGPAAIAVALDLTRIQFQEFRQALHLHGERLPTITIGCAPSERENDTEEHNAASEKAGKMSVVYLDVTYELS